MLGTSRCTVLSPRRVAEPLVIGHVGRAWLLDLVRKQFLAEFGGLDPLSVLDYLRVRLASVVQESFLDRLPQLRRVSIFVTCLADVVSKNIFFAPFFCFARKWCF